MTTSSSPNQVVITTKPTKQSTSIQLKPQSITKWSKCCRYFYFLPLRLLCARGVPVFALRVCAFHSTPHHATGTNTSSEDVRSHHPHGHRRMSTWCSCTTDCVRCDEFGVFPLFHLLAPPRAFRVDLPGSSLSAVLVSLACAGLVLGRGGGRRSARRPHAAVV